MSYSTARLFDRATPPHIVTLVLLAGVSALNMSIFLPSLPAMTEEFQTEYGIMQLSISLYLAFTAVLQILIGPLSDRYGRRPVVIGALAIFALASLGCYLSPTIEIFLTFRLIAASVAVGMVMSRAIVRDVVPMEEAASTIGYVTMGMSLVPMFAPTIGGFIDELFGWRAIFLFTFLFGGPHLYQQRHGRPMMRARHIPFVITESGRQEWLRCYRQTLDEAVELYDMPAEHVEAVWKFVTDFSAWMVNAVE